MTTVTLTLTSQQVQDVITQDGSVADLTAKLAAANKTIADRDATIAAKDALLAKIKLDEADDASKAGAHVSTIDAQDGP